MTTFWILIVVAQVSYGISVTPIEFVDKAACQEAAAKVIPLVGKSFGKVDALCVRKRTAERFRFGTTEEVE